MDNGRIEELPPFNTVNGIDYGLVGLYFVILVWVGIVAAGKNKDTNDYFR